MGNRKKTQRRHLFPPKQQVSQIVKVNVSVTPLINPPLVIPKVASDLKERK